MDIGHLIDGAEHSFIVITENQGEYGIAKKAIEALAGICHSRVETIVLTNEERALALQLQGKD